MSVNTINMYERVRWEWKVRIYGQSVFGYDCALLGGRQGLSGYRRPPTIPFSCLDLCCVRIFLSLTQCPLIHENTYVTLFILDNSFTTGNRWLGVPRNSGSPSHMGVKVWLVSFRSYSYNNMPKTCFKSSCVFIFLTCIYSIYKVFFGVGGGYFI